MITFQIDTNSPEALAMIEFLKTQPYAKQTSNFELPEWMEKETDKRLDEYEAGQSKTVDYDTFMKSL